MACIKYCHHFLYGDENLLASPRKQKINIKCSDYHKSKTAPNAVHFAFSKDFPISSFPTQARVNFGNSTIRAEQKERQLLFFLFVVGFFCLRNQNFIIYIPNTNNLIQLPSNGEYLLWWKEYDNFYVRRRLWARFLKLADSKEKPGNKLFRIQSFWTYTAISVLSTFTQLSTSSSHVYKDKQFGKPDVLLGVAFTLCSIRFPEGRCLLLHLKQSFLFSFY